MLKRFLVQISVLSACATFTACGTVTTAPQRGAASVDAGTYMPVAKNKATGDGGVLISYEFRGKSANESICRLRVVNKDTGKSRFVELKTDETASFAALDPGHYQTGRLGCGIGRVWDVDTVFAHGFDVQLGSASYVGKLIFNIDGGDLSEIIKASRSDIANAFSGAAAIVPNGMPIVSGFTKQVLTQDMVAEAGTGFDINAVGIANAGEKLQPLLTQLKGCDSAAANTDPLRFGRLDYTAVYSKGQFSEFKSRQDRNAFSDSLRSCVADKLASFHPTEKANVEIRVTY